MTNLSTEQSGKTTLSGNGGLSTPDARDTSWSSGMEEGVAMSYNMMAGKAPDLRNPGARHEVTEQLRLSLWVCLTLAGFTSPRG